MGKFTDIAKKTTVLSPLMQGRDKISTEALIKLYPEGVHISAFDLVNGTDDDGNAVTYPVFTFKEDESVFAYGGKAFRDIAYAWVESCDGDIEYCSHAVAKENVLLKFIQSRTKKGNNFTRVEVID